MKKILKKIDNKLFSCPFALGDVVRFLPDERALGWTQDTQGLYFGYVGSITKIIKGSFREWEIYVDNKTIGFPHVYYQLIEKGKSSEINS
jgi:hypothetical protein